MRRFHLSESNVVSYDPLQEQCSELEQIEPCKSRGFHSSGSIVALEVLIELPLLVVLRRLRNVPLGTDPMLCFYVIASSRC